MPKTNTDHDKALKEQVDEIVDKHRHFCTQADMFTGLSDVQTSHAIMQLIKEDRERVVREAKLEAGAKQAILDWHNKQIEEVLDRLEAEKLDLPTTPVDSHGYPQGGIQRIYPFIPLLAIEAERNKLKESN